MIGTDRTNSFTQDVDRLLKEAGRTDPDRPDPEYRKDLILAAELADTDFSAESTRGESLRRELLNGRAGEKESGTSRSAPMTWARRRHPLLAAAAVTAAVLIVVVFAQPTLRAAVVGPVIDFVKRLVVGEHTEAVAIAPPTEADREAILAERRRALEAGEQWTVETAIGQAGGGVPAGRDPVVRTYASLGLARSAAAFPVRTPGHLPDGYRFDRAVITPDDGVILWFRAPGARITLSQKPTQSGRYDMSMTVGGDGTVEEVTVHGRTAAWMNDEKLVWESRGTSWSLEGNRLTRDDALAIAESLE